MFYFRLMRKSDMPQVLKWRVSAEVAEFMQTEISEDMDSQYQWFERIDQDKRYLYWLIEHNGQKVGVLNLADIDLSAKSCSWGFYVGEHTFRNLGGLLPPYLYNALFTKTPLDLLVADVLETNELVQKLHKMHGYQEQGLLLETVEKPNQVIGLRRFVLHKSDWIQQKRYAKYLAEFEGLDNHFTH